jgi:hypothetical protein
LINRFSSEGAEKKGGLNVQAGSGGIANYEASRQDIISHN